MQDELTKTMATELGIAELGVAEQEKIIAGFGEVALKSATVAMLEKLPEDKRATFADLAEKGDAVALSSFLDREVPGHEAIASAAVASELTKFKESVTA